MTSPSDFEAEFTVNGDAVTYYSLARAEATGLGNFSRLPKSRKVLAENL